jgi:DNA-binding NarL/FixJ family response regulator
VTALGQARDVFRRYARRTSNRRWHEECSLAKGMFVFPGLLTILVIEDHAPFRQLICAELQRLAEFQITEATDGAEGIQKAEALKPDLILLDINLPKMHGFEVARRIRKLAPRASLLFMSQEDSPEIVRKALGLGADGYIHKISAATDLLPAIQAVVAGAQFVSRSLALAEPTGAPARRHEILFCADEPAIVASCARFIADALTGADAAILLVTQSRRTQLLLALRTQGIDIDVAIARGTCRSFDADIAPDRAALLDAVARARTAAVKAGKTRPRVAFCGERAGRLWAEGRTEETVQLERLCGELPQDVDILCLYPAPTTNDDPALTHICAEHTAVSTSL